MSRFVHRSLVRGDAAEVEAWHGRDGALRRLLPPWSGVEIVSGADGARPGERVELRVPVGPVRRRWVSEIRELEDGRGFRDVQVTGPFRRWIHDHRMEPAGERCRMVDRVEFDLPGGPVGRLAEGAVRDRLRRTFAYRHRTLDHDLAAHRRYGPGTSLHVAVSGSTGLVGASLVAFLRSGGNRVSRLVRREPGDSDEIRWIPEEGLPRPGALEGVDAVVHLAGENIAGLWTEAKRRRIRGSRVPATRRLCRDLADLPSPPAVFVSASGVNYYGDRGEERLTEASDPGDGFLAGVCREWEEASRPLEAAGCRVVRLRFGMVLTPAGGALAAMLPAFRAGVGGPLGDGQQFMAWIALDDLLEVILHALSDEDLSGAVNAVGRRPVRNREFTETLARVLRRPAALRVPAPVLRTVGGRMAREMLLSSLRVEPGALSAADHRYRHRELEGALRHLLGRTQS